MTPEPRRNVELKAVDRDPAATLNVALASGATDHGTLRQRDTYFAVPHGRLKLREQDGSSAQLIAYERPDDPAVRLSRYHLIEVADPEATIAGLTATCGVKVVVAKQRRLLEWENVRIHLDDVAGLGRYIELEAVAAPGADLGEERRKVDRLRDLLDIRDGDLRPGSYADALMPPPDPELLRLARAVATNAYAPYSHLHIGAAVRTDDGRRYAGANVENAAYPQGWCAEASALAALVGGGGGRVAEVVVASSHAVAPCGGCRQKLAEFAGGEVKVTLATTRGAVLETTVAELLPGAFTDADMA